MLARAHRLTRGRDFADTVRRGRRAGRSTVVLHLGRGGGPGSTPRVGLVVGKAIGDAVTRNQVKRRLRHLARERIPVLPADAVLVIRALPPAASASSAELGRDLDAALGRLVPQGHP